MPPHRHCTPPAHRPPRRLGRFTLAATTALALGIGSAVTAQPALSHAEPVAATADINSPELSVTVSRDFPQVVRYTSGGRTLTGNAKALNAITINGKTERVTVRSMINRDKARYDLTVPGLPGTTLQAELSVAKNVTTFRITRISEGPGVKIRTLQIAGHDLATISSADPAGTIAAARTSVDRAKSGDTIAPVTAQTPTDKTEGSSYIVANTADLAAGFESNSLYDSGTAEASMDNSRWLRTGTKNPDGTVSVGISSGQWLYRAKGSDQPEELPWAKVVITPDANGDNAVDWQDGAIATRDIAVMPNKGEDVKNKVVQRIPFNFASQATHPFLRTLDDTKRIARATDGLGQSALLKGFGSEGHDSANTDFADNYNTRAGGLTDLNKLLDESAKWNTTYGIHINQTEAYPESHFFDDALVKPAEPGWNWLDQSYYIRQDRDVLTGNLANRVKKFREQTHPGLDMVYVDVFYQHGWLADRLQKELVKNGFRVGSEWADKLPRNNTWSHWAVDEEYGGSTNKGVNSQIQRFIFNDVKDTWNPNPLLGNTTLVEFEGWTGQTDYNAFLTNTWVKNLPAKFLQQQKITSWQDREIKFTGGVTSRGSSADDRVIEVDGQQVARGGTYLLPWRDGSGAKAYHWNPAGGKTTWTLTGELAKSTSVDLYALSDTGRGRALRVPVRDGKVTLDAKAGQPYVLTATPGALPAESDFGSGTPVKDPGFNNPDFNRNWTARDATMENFGNGHRVAKLGSGAASLSQQLGALEPGTHSVSAWVEIEPGKKRHTTIAVDGRGVKPAEVSLDASTATNQMAADEKHSSKFQRLRVLVDVTSAGATPRLTIKADPGAAAVRVDDVRVVKTTRQDAQGTVYVENFEDVDQGWGPFIKGEAGGVTDPRTHLSERNEPYTQAGWNTNVVDDVLHGQWSLKSNSENRNPDGSDGLVYRTSDSTIPFTPGHRYKVSFDHQNSHAGEYAWASGYDTADGPVTTQRQSLGEQRTTGRLAYEFTAGACGANWTGLLRTGGNGSAIFSLDDLKVEDLGAADSQPACATLTVDPQRASVFPGKDNTVTTRLTSNEPNPVTDVKVALALPQGWTATATSPAEAATLAPGATLTTTWNVVPPADAKGVTDVGVTGTYNTGDATRTVTSTLQTHAVAVFEPGDTWASDQGWVSAENGWGPVERDQSNGEQGQGDGRPLTLQGTVYPKGLGTHAPSTVRYYTGGSCTRFTSDVGLDDAQASRGSVTFSVLADGKQVAASSGVMGPDTATQTLDADISGAEFVDLVVGDGGDGNGNDHADWAGAKFTCQ